MAKQAREERLDDFLTIAQAAAFLGVCASTLRNWDRSGKMKSRRHPLNGYRLYRRKDLQRLIDQLKKQR